MNSKWQLLYYVKKDGTKPVEEYIKKCSINERAKTLAFIEHLIEKGPDLNRPYADLLEDGIHELRIKLTGNQVRILYFFCYNDIIILTNVFEKHTDKVPKSEIKIAKKYRNDFLGRYTEQEIRRLL
ncbi:MAG: type II toxin-antitoxin system RelE/ParE family toxin [Treponema sp.]|jgi:phage-related protein|nr:type II toxin-antitoxin system RelE/ParE family toxin [Treponema sp.]